MWGTVEQMRDHYKNTPGLSGRAPVDVLDCLNEIERLAAEVSSLRAARDAGNDPFMAEMADVCNENTVLCALLREIAPKLHDAGDSHYHLSVTWCSGMAARIDAAVPPNDAPTDDPWTLHGEAQATLRADGGREERR